MAHTAHTTADRLEEIEMSSEEVAKAAQQIADLMKASKHTVIFTGAGISTSAGVPDFRGPQGVWTLKAQGRDSEIATVPLSCAVPTATHMAIVQLQRHGLVQFVISQNIDGLHRKSGLAHNTIAELHGNHNTEQCESCNKRYLRDWNIDADDDHYTGRRCSAKSCNGRLRDTIINFEENLPMAELANAFAHSERAELHLCLGSSLSVRPARDMPKATHDRGGKLAIVNLQRTPLDQFCDVRVHARVDVFIAALLQALGIAPATFAVSRRLAVWVQDNRLAVAGVDTDATPQSIVKGFAVDGRETVFDPNTWQEPLVSGETYDRQPHAVEIEFFGHYAEPPLRLQLPADFVAASWRLRAEPGAESWECELDEQAILPSFAKGDHSPTQLLATPKAVSDATGMDYTGWFAVTPIAGCAHSNLANLSPSAHADVTRPCSDCGNVGENMLCLTCDEVHCGRHVNGHMLNHHDVTSHPLVIGFADLSCWCYPCGAYVNTSNPNVRPFYRLLHLSKFGCAPH